MFLQGEQDVFISHKAEKPWVWIAAEHPNVHVIRTPDAGHLPWLDDPERVVAEIERFLAIEPPSRVEAATQSGQRSTSGANSTFARHERRTAVRRGDPGTKLVVIPHASHVSNLERPDQFNDAVRGFWRAVHAASA